MADNTGGGGDSGLRDLLERIAASGRMSPADIKETADSYKKIQEYLESVNKEHREWKGALKDILESEDLVEKAQERLGKKAKELVGLQNEINEGLHGTLTQTQARQLLEDELFDISKKQERVLQNQLKNLEDIVDSADEAAVWFESIKEDVENTSESVEDLSMGMRKFEKATTKARQPAKILEGHFSRMLEIVTGISGNFEDTFLGSFMEVAKQGNVLKTLGQSIINITGGFKMGLLRGFISGMQKLVQQAVAAVTVFDGVTASFAAATGTGDRYRESIERNWRENAKLHVSLEENAEAFKDLRANFSGLMTVSQATQGRLAAFTAQMSAVGIAGADAAKLSSTVFKAFGGGEKEVKNITLEFAHLADTMNKNVNQVISEFNSLMPQLARYGKDATRVFKELQYISAKTGVSLETMMSAAGQFDTIEGAAEAVGSLNALLGGPYLNTVDMLGKSESERIKTMQDSIRMSGLQWDSMNKFQKMAIANKMGITDMNEATMLFSNTIKAQEMRQAAEANKKSQEEWNKSVELGKTFVQKLMGAFMQLSPKLEPVVEKLAMFAHTLINLIDHVLPEEGESWWSHALGLLIIPAGLSLITGLLGGLGMLLAGKIIPAVGSTSVALNTFAASGLNAAQGMAAMKGAMYASLGTGAMLAMIIVSVGAAIYMASAGVAHMATAIQNLNSEQLNAFVDIMLIGAAVLVSFAVALGILAAAGTAAAAPLGLLGLALLPIATSMALVIGANAALVASIAAMMNAFSGFGARISEIEAFSGAFESLGELSDAKITAMSGVFGEVRGVLDSAAAAGPHNQDVKEIMQSVTSVDATKVAGVNATATMLKELVKVTEKITVTTAGGGSPGGRRRIDGPFEFTFKFDKDVFGKVAFEHMKDRTEVALNGG